MTRDWRTVIDTGVVVSAVLLPHSVPRQAFDLAAARGPLLVSDKTIAELDEVLHPFRGIAIVNPQSFLAIVGVQGPEAEPRDRPDRNRPGETV